jgi:hypothetical protein
MTNPEFDLDLFLSCVSFGGLHSHFLLFSVLSYLGEKHLIARVRATLTRFSPSDSLAHSFAKQIKREFPYDENAPDCLNAAIGLMRLKLNHLLSSWDEKAHVPGFVNPFRKVFAISPEGPISYAELVGDLESFFDCCRHVVDWEDGCFPPRGYIGPEFDGCGVAQFVIQPWYPRFYNWAVQSVRKVQKVVQGCPGIGKSVFGLYFMARLVASDLQCFHGHGYFVLSWNPKRRDDGKRVAARTLDVHELAKSCTVVDKIVRPGQNCRRLNFLIGLFATRPIKWLFQAI